MKSVIDEYVRGRIRTVIITLIPYDLAHKTHTGAGAFYLAARSLTRYEPRFRRTALRLLATVRLVDPRSTKLKEGGSICDPSPPRLFSCGHLLQSLPTYASEQFLGGSIGLWWAVSTGLPPFALGYLDSACCGCVCSLCVVCLFLFIFGVDLNP